MDPNSCQEVKYYCRNRLQVDYTLELRLSFACCLPSLRRTRRRRQERACAITIIVFWPSQSYNHSSRSYNIMYVLKAQQKKEGTRAWLSSSLVFAHGGRNLRHLGSWYFLLYYVLLHTLQLGTHTHTLIHQVIIGDVQKTDHIGPFWQGQLAPSNQENLRFFPAHFVQNMNILRTFFYSTG